MLLQQREAGYLSTHGLSLCPAVATPHCGRRNQGPPTSVVYCVLPCQQHTSQETETDVSNDKYLTARFPLGCDKQSQ